MEKEQLLQILEKITQGTATPEEYDFFKAYYNFHEVLTSRTEEMTEDERETLKLGIRDNIFKEIYEDHQQASSGVTALHSAAPGRGKRRGLVIPGWLRYAAVFIIVAGAAAYLWLSPGSSKIGRMASAKTSGDITPGGNKALLTLSDGNTILLDSAAAGQLALQGNANVIKSAAGKITYRLNGAADQFIRLNTLSTPRGGQYQLTLPDGTNVWLNALSSITYPVAFGGKDRKVTVTGEAYFEVARDKTKPFIVVTPKDQVTVLGTAFNVNCYADEPVRKTTLLEGAVQIGAQVLKPGEACLNGKVVAVDTDKAIAWKNGLFDFNGAGMEELMRQVARWYDIEVVYQDGIPDKEFVGKLSRNASLKTLLKALEYANVHFTIEGRRIIVLPDTKK
jgi:ferric-dicitrate binding protein FerR (iron transport regulator)